RTVLEVAREIQTRGRERGQRPAEESRNHAHHDHERGNPPIECGRGKVPETAIHVARMDDRRWNRHEQQEPGSQDSADRAAYAGEHNTLQQRGASELPASRAEGSAYRELAAAARGARE